MCSDSHNLAERVNVEDNGGEPNVFGMMCCSEAPVSQRFAINNRAAVVARCQATVNGANGAQSNLDVFNDAKQNHDFNCDELSYLQFIEDAIAKDWPGERVVKLPPDVHEALLWCRNKPAEKACFGGAAVLGMRPSTQHLYLQIMQEREAIVQRIENRAAELWSSGTAESWHRHTEPQTRRVAGDVCGPLLEELARDISWPDMAAIDMFREAELVRRVVVLKR